jgi:acyl-CoA thioester hydrolase
VTEIIEKEPFEWPIRVYYEDTDAQGVVYYANYFRFMERARTEWLRALGVNQEKMLNEERRMFVVTKTELEFIVPARFNDELIVTADTLRPQRVPVSIFEEQ